MPEVLLIFQYMFNTAYLYEVMEVKLDLSHVVVSVTRYVRT